MRSVFDIKLSKRHPGRKQMKFTTAIVIISVLICSEASNTLPSDTIIGGTSPGPSVEPKQSETTAVSSESEFEGLLEEVSAQLSEYLAIPEFVALAQTNKSSYRLLCKVSMDKLLESNKSDEWTFKSLLPFSLEYLSTADLSSQKLGEVYAHLFTLSETEQTSAKLFKSWQTRGIDQEAASSFYQNIISAIWSNEENLKFMLAKEYTKYAKHRYQFFYPIALLTAHKESEWIRKDLFGTLYKSDIVDDEEVKGSEFFKMVFSALPADYKQEILLLFARAYVLGTHRPIGDGEYELYKKIRELTGLSLPDVTPDDIRKYLDICTEEEYWDLRSMCQKIWYTGVSYTPFDHPNVAIFDGALRNLAEQLLEGAIADIGVLMKMSLQKLIMFSLEIRNLLFLREERHPSLGSEVSDLQWINRQELADSQWKQSSVEGMMVVSLAISSHSMEDSLSIYVNSRPGVPIAMILSKVQWKFVLQFPNGDIKQMLKRLLINEVKETFTSAAPSNEIIARYRELLAIPEFLELMKEVVVYSGDTMPIIRNLAKLFPEYAAVFTGLFPHFNWSWYCS